MNPNVTSVACLRDEDEDYEFSDHDGPKFPPCAHLTIVDPIVAEERRNIHTSCPIPIDRQIASLAKLDDGWYDDSSHKYERIELRWLTSLLTAIVNTYSLPRPYIYPTPEGFVRAEWSSSGSEVIVTIDLSRRSADVIAFRLASESIEDIPVDFADVDSEARLGRFIASYVSETNY